MATQQSPSPAAATSVAHVKREGPKFSWIVPLVYIVFLMIPIYWLVVISFKSNFEVMNSFSIIPQDPTLRNYKVILTDSSWYLGYVNSITYVLMNMVISLLIAVLLRFMDSFMIYTEAVVLTGGGPGNATTLLSIDLVKTALGQFDLGPAAAMSLIYFLIILLLSWLFYTVMTKDDER